MVTPQNHWEAWNLINNGQETLDGTENLLEQKFLHHWHLNVEKGLHIWEKNTFNIDEAYPKASNKAEDQATQA